MAPSVANRLARLVEKVRAHRPEATDLGGDPARAAVGVLAEERSDDVHLLFIRRAEHEADPWSGHMAFPGGFREPHDDDLVATVAREVREEIAVKLDGVAELVGPLDEIQGVARGRELPLVITPFLFRLRGSIDPVPNEEVQRIVWVPLGFLADDSNVSTIDWHRGSGSPVRLPAYVYEGETIWGLTYRMVRNLLDVIR